MDQAYLYKGGFLEWSMSNTYAFVNSLKNDIVLRSDTSNQNILFGVDNSNDTSAFMIQTDKNVFFRPIWTQCNAYIGTNYSSNVINALICDLGNAQFTCNVCIGDSNVITRLTITGPSNDPVLGPHVTYCLQYRDPVYQQLNYNHDSIFQSYDAFYNSNEKWTSTSSNGNFIIAKESNCINIYVSKNNAYGSNFVLTNPTFSVMDTSCVGINIKHPGAELHVLGNSFMEGNAWIRSNLSFSSNNVFSCPSQNILNINGDVEFFNDVYTIGSNVTFLSQQDLLPTFQTANKGHDAIYQSYDMSLKENSWISSSSNGNFAMIKEPNMFSIYASSNNAPKQTVQQLNVAISVADNAFVGVGHSNPLYPLDVIGISMFQSDVIILDSQFQMSNATGLISIDSANYSMNINNDTVLQKSSSLTFSNGTGNISISSAGNTLDVFGRCFVASGIEIGNNGITHSVYNTENNTSWTYDNTTNSTFILNTNVGIGIVNPQYLLDVNGDIHVNGTVSSLSDERYKKNIRGLSNCLDSLCLLNGYSYKNHKNESSTEYGVIAQEVMKVFPELVDHDHIQDLYSVKYNNIIPLLIESIKELKYMIKRMEIIHRTC